MTLGWYRIGTAEVSAGLLALKRDQRGNTCASWRYRDAMSFKRPGCCISDTVVFRGWEPQSYNAVNVSQCHVFYAVCFPNRLYCRFHEAIIHCSWAHLYEETMTTTVEGAFADDKLGTAQSSIGWVIIFHWLSPHVCLAKSSCFTLVTCLRGLSDFFFSRWNPLNCRFPMFEGTTFMIVYVYIYIIIYIHSIH